MNTDLLFSRDEIEEYTRLENNERYWRKKKELYMTNLINHKVVSQISLNSGGGN